MTLKTIRTACFTVCITSIILSVLLGLAMIWNLIQRSDFTWKAFLTLGVFFLASLLTLAVARQLGVREE